MASQPALAPAHPGLEGLACEGKVGKNNQAQDTEAPETPTNGLASSLQLGSIQPAVGRGHQGKGTRGGRSRRDKGPGKPLGVDAPGRARGGTDRHGKKRKAETSPGNPEGKGTGTVLEGGGSGDLVHGQPHRGQGDPAPAKDGRSGHLGPGKATASPEKDSEHAGFGQPAKIGPEKTINQATQGQPGPETIQKKPAEEGRRGKGPEAKQNQGNRGTDQGSPGTAKPPAEKGQPVRSQGSNGKGNRRTGENRCQGVEGTPPPSPPVEQNQQPLERGKLGPNQQPVTAKGRPTQGAGSGHQRSLGGTEPALENPLGDQGNPEGTTHSPEGEAAGPVAAPAQPETDGMDRMAHGKERGGSKNSSETGE
jgi:hypothetical protein